MSTPVGIIASRTIDPSEPVEPVSWVVPNFAARGYLTVLAGQAGIGKSTLALQLAADVGTSEAPSLYLDIENGPEHLRRLSAAIGIAPGQVELVDMAGLSLTDSDTLARLTAEILGKSVATMARHHRLGVPLVVLDSLRRFAPGRSENSSDDMAPYIASLTTLARTTRSAVVLIHHASSKPDAPTLRGSTAIEDQADLVLTLTKQRDTIKLACSKCRPAAQPTPSYYRRQADPLRLVETIAPPSSTVTSALADRLRTLSMTQSPPWRLNDIGAVLDLDTSADTDSRKLRRAIDELTRSGEWVKHDRGLYGPVA